MGKIDIEKVNELRNSIKKNIGFTLMTYTSKSTSISRKMDFVIRNYASYSDVVSKAKQIQRTVNEIKREVESITNSYDKIIKGLSGVISCVKQGDAEAKSIIRQTPNKIEKTSIGNKFVFGMDRYSLTTGKNSKKVDEKFLSKLLEREETNNLTNDEYQYLVNVFHEKGYVDINDLKNVGIYRDEPSLQKICADLNEQYMIIKYSIMGQQVEEMSLEECDNEIKALLEGLQGEIIGRDGFGRLIVGDLEHSEEYEKGIEQYLNLRGIYSIYDLLSEDPKTQKQLLLYWLTVERTGGNICDAPAPSAWVDATIPADIKVTEENYKEMFDDEEMKLFFIKNQFISKLMSPDYAPETFGELYSAWYKEKYGHLDPDSHNIQRLKYLISEDLGISLTNEEGYMIMKRITNIRMLLIYGSTYMVSMMSIGINFMGPQQMKKY